MTTIPTGGSARATRDLYIDTLRAAALGRVVLYHVYGWFWLPVTFPSMGIMFAMAGSLMALSLDRATRWPWGVVGRRIRRLVPPLWLMAAVLVPLMLAHGWTNRGPDSAPLDWRSLLFWLVPLSDPPGSDWGADWVSPLWYIRAYLWFVLLSPAFLWLFRRWPRWVLALPFGVMALSVLGWVDLDGRGGDVVLGLATYGGCWLIGFADQDGTLRAMKWRFVVPLAVGLLAAGLAWALTHPRPDGSWNVDDIPPAQMLYSLGAVLLLLRGRPSLGWLRRRRWAVGLVAAVNARAVTIYLWNNVAVFLAVPLLDAWDVTSRLNSGGLGQFLILVVAVLALLVIIPLVGWVEDLAARRPPRLNPWPRTRPPASPAADDGTAVEQVGALPVMEDRIAGDGVVRPGVQNDEMELGVSVGDPSRAVLDVGPVVVRATSDVEVDPECCAVGGSPEVMAPVALGRGPVAAGVLDDEVAADVRDVDARSGGQVENIVAGRQRVTYGQGDRVSIRPDAAGAAMHLGMRDPG